MMYILKNDADFLVSEFRKKMISELFDEVDFLKKTADSDDWAFILKIQAQIETALNSSIFAKIGIESLRKNIDQLPLIGTHVSKLGFTKSLELTTSKQRSYITEIAQIRNKLAHSKNGCDFNFSNYLSELDDNQKKSWQKNINWFCEDATAKKTWDNLAIRAPRATIYMGNMQLIVHLSTFGSENNFSRKLSQLQLK